jgi:hypothetical protein
MIGGIMTQPSRQIEVDLDQLRESCQTVKRDTELGLRPGLHETDRKIHQGIPFGRRSPSGEADAAAQALAYALKRHARNSVSHLQHAEQIVAFLDQILSDYSDADAISALNVELVLGRLNDAMPAAMKRQPASGAQP